MTSTHTEVSINTPVPTLFSHCVTELRPGTAECIDVCQPRGSSSRSAECHLNQMVAEVAGPSIDDSLVQTIDQLIRDGLQPNVSVCEIPAETFQTKESSH